MACVTDVFTPRHCRRVRATALGSCLQAALSAALSMIFSTTLSTAHAGDDEIRAPETAPGVSLRHLVDVARHNKAAELAAATARLAGSMRPPGDPAVPATATTRGVALAEVPRLWSLMSAGNRWRAEVLLRGRVHAVDSSSGPETRVGPWRVLGLTPEGLRFERVAAGGRAPRHLVLSPPAQGAAAASYRFDGGRSPVAGNSAQTGVGRLDAGDGNGNGDNNGNGNGNGDVGVGVGGGVDVGGGDAVRRATALPLPAAAAPSSAHSP